MNHPILSPLFLLLSHSLLSYGLFPVIGSTFYKSDLLFRTNFEDHRDIITIFDEFCALQVLVVTASKEEKGCEHIIYFRILFC